MAALPVQGSAAVFASCKAQASVAGQAAESCHAPDQGRERGKDSLKAHGKCSTCASCCSAAAAPPLVFDLPAPSPRPARAHAPPEAALAAGFPAVPERPPRAFS